MAKLKLDREKKARETAIRQREAIEASQRARRLHIIEARVNVKAAYRKKVWESHPDLFPHDQKLRAESKFKSISEAYSCLESGISTEVLHLLESPEAVKPKVAEAMDVLRSVAHQQAGGAADQLASFSLGDNIVP